MPVKPRTAAKRLALSLGKLSEIIFDEDWDEGDSKTQKGAHDASRIGNIAKGGYWRIGKNSFTMSFEDLNWFNIMNEYGGQSEEAEKAFELFWLIANHTVPGWSADMADNVSIVWYPE